MDFVVGQAYSRRDVQNALGVAESNRGGDWLTGYTEFGGEFFIFCNIDSAGRTGHNYRNFWDGDSLVWSAKNRTTMDQPQIRRLASNSTRIHVFYRNADRSPFKYAGIATPLTVQPTTPVLFRFGFETDGTNSTTPQNIDLPTSAIILTLQEVGFSINDRNVKTIHASRGNINLYIKNESKRWPVVIDPRFENKLGALLSVAGARRPTDRFFYHNSTMRSFPQRMNHGSTPIPFGIDFSFETQNSFRLFIDELTNVDSDASDQFFPAIAEDDRETDGLALRKVRLTQQAFRNELLEYWKGRCAVTGLTKTELLKASHITPWANSTDAEKKDPNNGLLLAVHIDGLFDRGFISFAADGRMIISPKLTESERACFGISDDCRISGLSDQHKKYLSLHRARHKLPE